jgi:hypothetical protein
MIDIRITKNVTNRPVAAQVPMRIKHSRWFSVNPKVRRTPKPRVISTHPRAELDYPNPSFWQMEVDARKSIA